MAARSLDLLVVAVEEVLPGPQSPWLLTLERALHPGIDMGFGGFGDSSFMEVFESWFLQRLTVSLATPTASATWASDFPATMRGIASSCWSFRACLLGFALGLLLGEPFAFDPSTRAFTPHLCFKQYRERGVLESLAHFGYRARGQFKSLLCVGERHVNEGLGRRLATRPCPLHIHILH